MANDITVQEVGEPVAQAKGSPPERRAGSDTRVDEAGAIGDALARMGTLGHDLANSLNSVKLTMLVVQENLETMPREKLTRYLENAVSAANRGAQFLAELREVQRALRGQLEAWGAVGTRESVITPRAAGAELDP